MDFPAPGVQFRDITPLLADHDAFEEAVRRMCEPWRGERIDLVAAMEARGYWFAAPMALELGAGLVPVRKPGKLPRTTRSVEYSLEYRSDTLHVHEDAIRPGQRVLIVDDVLATGGTAWAATRLAERLGGDVVGLGFFVELGFLRGRDRLGDRDLLTLVDFE